MRKKQSKSNLSYSLGQENNNKIQLNVTESQQVCFSSYDQQIDKLIQQANSQGQRNSLLQTFKLYLLDSQYINPIKKRNKLSQLDLQDQSKGFQKQIFYKKCYKQNRSNISSRNQQKKSKKVQNFQNINYQNLDLQEFTLEQRQSLKNAFRYICRLIFKQAHKYPERFILEDAFTKDLKQNLKIEEPNSQRQMSLNKNQVNQIQKTKKIKKEQRISKEEFIKIKNRQNQNHQKTKILNQHDKHQKFIKLIKQLRITQQAQLISGQRYFKQYLAKLQGFQKQILLKYMIWFLKFKYLRYINKCNNQNKGKRKQMKKQLYIRYKNTIMLPYLHQVLSEMNLSRQTQTN